MISISALSVRRKEFIRIRILWQRSFARFSDLIEFSVVEEAAREEIPAVKEASMAVEVAADAEALRTPRSLRRSLSQVRAFAFQERSLLRLGESRTMLLLGIKEFLSSSSLDMNSQLTRLSPDSSWTPLCFRDELWM